MWFFKKWCLRIIKLKTKDIYRHFSWGRFRSSRVLCVFLAVDLSWTLLDLAILWENAWKFMHMLCCFVTQTPRFWGNASCLTGCLALMIEWKLLKIKERLFGFSWTKLYWSKVCVLGRMFLWGNFQRKVGGKFMLNSRQISLAAGCYWNPCGTKTNGWPKNSDFKKEDLSKPRVLKKNH